jgi:hypothetical protein
MQLTIFVPFLVFLASTTNALALPTPDDAVTSSTDDTDHYHPAPQNPVVATADLWAKGGCRPQVCNHNFLVNLNGCSVVPKGCATSARITTGSDNCYCEFSFSNL